MTSAPQAPGLYFTVQPREPEKSPLRSDVAAFTGRTRRGPLGTTVRVEGWRAYLATFGGLDAQLETPYSIRGYFENGGEVAWVVRLTGDPSPATPVATAGVVLQVGALDAAGIRQAGFPAGFRFGQYRFEGSSPGAWANGTQVTVQYRLEGFSGTPEVDVVVEAPDEPVEYLPGIEPELLEERVAERSRLIRVLPIGLEAQGPQPLGPRQREWMVTLAGGVDPAPSRVDYLDAIRILSEEPEIALVALPDLYTDLNVQEEQIEVLNEAIQKAEDLHDRMVLIDLPPDVQDANAALAYAGERKAGELDKALRASAIYHPRLRIPDPKGGIAHPVRVVPPSGHVAGVISRLDRLRGAHHTPANAPMFEVVDVTTGFDRSEQALLNEAGVNLLRCMPGRGIVVWGGRTLGGDLSTFIAHRRLIHRLVRAIRRVAEPLVFDINGPELWLTLVRAITTVLLEAWRAGALQGARPEEAFLVKCDAETNPPEEQDLGRMLCEIELAPAVPMEFILLRVSLSADQGLEIFES
ncbi:MAG: phage tail sheath family protein [Bryobacteraceae bacterium]